MSGYPDLTPREVVACNLCGGSDTRLWATKNGFSIVQCRSCSLIYTNPRLDAEQRVEYYKGEYHSGYDDDPVRGRMYERDIQEMVQIVGESGRFLDVGCAYGRFLTYLPATFEKHGIEFSEEAASYGRRRFGVDIQAGDLHSVRLEDDSYDVVHFRGVFEHIPDPQRELEAARRILKPGGWLVLSTVPNIGGPCGIVFRERFRLVDPCGHIYYFSRSTLSRYCRKNGLEILHVRYPYLGTPYERLWRDAVRFIIDSLGERLSPPFFRSVITVYARKSLAGE